MDYKGSFGYKIGRKIRLMRVDSDVDLMWQICVREIYVLMKHYGSMESLRQVFEGLIDAKNKPKLAAIEKCKPFTDFKIVSNDWYCLTKNCQQSFINILETGYFLNNGKDLGLVFLLDFTTNSVRFYSKDSNNKIIEHNKATIEEVMDFDEMPIKSLTDIIKEMMERYKNHCERIEKVNGEEERIKDIINKAQELGGDKNIIDRAKKMMEDIGWKKKQLEMEYRFFYHRMDALNLIDYSDK